MNELRIAVNVISWWVLLVFLSTKEYGKVWVIYDFYIKGLFLCFTVYGLTNNRIFNYNISMLTSSTYIVTI